MWHAVDGRGRGRASALRSVCAVVVVAVLALVPGLSSARADTPPYSLPVALPAGSAKSPAVDARAPYTPVVVDLIHQLEPDNPPTRAELANASRLLHGGTNAVTPGPFQNPSCHNVGPVSAPTGTNPSIMP